ncbi:Ig-like domain-containing protein [Streptomyces sp. NPDC096040]|uniref:Ig-like domain-containing protein n=1 Tax=Streptomyces sp. NPDC096040 TaxID=3155541 RepID=UPI00331C7C94
MTVPHPFRRAAALAAACALAVLGLVALVTSQSQPARAASVGEFTMTPGSGSLTGAQPIAGSLGFSGACPDATIEDINWNSVLALYVVKADGTEARAMTGITDQAPYTGASSTVSLAAADNPGMDVSSLSDIITGDGTYELRLRCVENDDWSIPPSSIVPGDPYWSQKITVTGNQWVVGEGATATGVALTAVPSVAAPGAAVKLTATLSPAEATGTVTFLDGDTTLGQATVSDGKAELTTTTLSEDTHHIVAKFTPSSTADWGTSESDPFQVVVQLPRYEMYDNGSGDLLADNPQLERGQSVKLLLRGCEPGTKYTMTMRNNDSSFPAATADASGTVTWPTLTVPEGAVAGQTYWDNTPDCTGGSYPVAQVNFTLAEPSSESPSATPTDGSSDEPTDQPTDGSSTEPTDGSSGDTSGTTSGTAGGDTTSGGSSTTSGGSSGSGGGLASTGSQIALFSGVGAVILTGAGIAFVRYGRRNGLLTFGEPRA